MQLVKFFVKKIAIYFCFFKVIIAKILMLFISTTPKNNKKTRRHLYLRAFIIRQNSLEIQPLSLLFHQALSVCDFQLND